MGSEVLRPNSEGDAPTSSSEVEFALVLSRMIDSVNNDPEHLRATLYELARHKLKEQFGSDQSVDMRNSPNPLRLRSTASNRSPKKKTRVFRPCRSRAVFSNGAYRRRTGTRASSLRLP